MTHPTGIMTLLKIHAWNKTRFLSFKFYETSIKGKTRQIIGRTTIFQTLLVGLIENILSIQSLSWFSSKSMETLPQTKFLKLRSPGKKSLTSKENWLTPVA